MSLMDDMNPKDIWLRCEWRRVDMPPAYVEASLAMILRAMADLKPADLDAMVKAVNERARVLQDHDAEFAEANKPRGEG